MSTNTVPDRPRLKFGRPSLRGTSRILAKLVGYKETDMAYNKPWNITINRTGREYKYSSPNGEATITNEESGWIVRGEISLDRYDARPMAEVPYAEDDYTTMETVCRDQDNRIEYKAGKFEQAGFKEYILARGYAWSRVCLTPKTVPFEVARDSHDKYAEAKRDWDFYQKRVAEYGDARKSNPDLQNDERFNDPATAYQLLVVEGFKIPAAPKPPKPVADKPDPKAPTGKKAKGSFVFDPNNPPAATMPEGKTIKTENKMTAKNGVAVFSATPV